MSRGGPVILIVEDEFLLRLDSAETIEESGLCRVWLGHAAQANLAMR